MALTIVLYKNKIKIIYRCDSMLQDVKHSKTVIMSSLKAFLSTQVLNCVQWVQSVHRVHSVCPWLGEYVCGI